MVRLRLLTCILMMSICCAGCGTGEGSGDLSDPSVIEATEKWDEQVAEDESSL